MIKKNLSNWMKSLVFLSLSTSTISSSLAFGQNTPTGYFPVNDRHDYTGKEAVIAVLDGDFLSGDQILEGYDAVNDSQLIINGSPGHGAGVVKIITELAPHVKILPIGIRIDYGSNATLQLQRAFQFILNKKKVGLNITTVNMSYEFGPSTLEGIEPELTRLVENEINFIKSADNHNEEIRGLTKSLSENEKIKPGMLVVGAHENSNSTAPGYLIKKEPKFPEGSNYPSREFLGNFITAPGKLALGYISMTSAATPFVAAADALLHEKNPNLRSADRVQIILEKSLEATIVKKKTSLAQHFQDPKLIELFSRKESILNNDYIQLDLNSILRNETH